MIFGGRSPDISQKRDKCFSDRTLGTDSLTPKGVWSTPFNHYLGYGRNGIFDRTLKFELPCRNSKISRLVLVEKPEIGTVAKPIFEFLETFRVMAEKLSNLFVKESVLEPDRARVPLWTSHHNNSRHRVSSSVPFGVRVL